MVVKGVITALVTPFNDNGTIDYDALYKLIDLQIDAGIDGIILGGTTGEGMLIEELDEFYQQALEFINGKVKVGITLFSKTKKELTEKINKYKNFLTLTSNIDEML